MSFKIGIVGLGYVGGAILNSYVKKNIKVNTYDIAKESSCGSLNELVDKSDIIYVAVPTPMSIQGNCDISIVESVITQISTEHSNKIIVIKSTVPPGTTETLQNRYRTNTILFSPEFLTEANYTNDYLHQEMMLIGKPTLASQIIAHHVLSEQIDVVESVKHPQVVDATIAELHKYIANSFLAVKVSFANEMATLATNLGIDWVQMQKLIINDSRLGTGHWKVPGPDGHTGFGGTCFPKDISAIRYLANTLDVPTPVLDSAWNRNITIDRPEKDWEQLKGRAIS